PVESSVGLSAHGPSMALMSGMSRLRTSGAPAGPVFPGHPGRWDSYPCRLPPAKFVQACVVDTEMVCHLMYHGDQHLVDDLVFAVTDFQDRFPVDRDAVGQYATVVVTAFGQGHTVVEPEEIGFLLIAVLHEDHHVVHRGGELGWQLVERVGDELLEPLPRHVHGHRLQSPLPGAPLGAGA